VRRLWYRWYFDTGAGRDGLEANRRALYAPMWRGSSPTWGFTAEQDNTDCGSTIPPLLRYD
jgi:hypothetical protein